MEAKNNQKMEIITSPRTILLSSVKLFSWSKLAAFICGKTNLDSPGDLLVLLLGKVPSLPEELKNITLV